MTLPQTVETIPHSLVYGPGRYQAVRRTCRAAFVAIWTLLGFAAGTAQQPKYSESDVKAAYLYNFGNFIEWPAKSMESKSGFFSICILGQDPFGSTLDATLAGETISGKKVVAKRFSKPQEVVNCPILFISSSEEGRLTEIISSLDKMSILTVSDMPEFVRRGGMVQFVLEQNKVRFEINLASTEHAGLKMSSQLLRLATLVRKNPQPGD
jgi:YfiR/HmsC-like